MKVALSELGGWNSPAFFEKGAFITDTRTQEVILAQGGTIEVSSQIDSEPAFYLKDFFLNRYLRYRPEQWFRTTKESLLTALVNFNHQIEVIEAINQDAVYAQDFADLKQAFSEKLKKVVLISREEFKVRDPLKARQKILLQSMAFGTGFPYGFWFKDYGVIGSTPEILFTINKERLNTFALAGTAMRNQEERLLNSKKDRLEHDLVIQDIKEKLSHFCSNVANEPTGTISFKDLIHLKTDISAKIGPGIDLTALTSALSPTAALGGYPTHESLEFLTKTRYRSLYPERYFGSAFGLVGQEIRQFIVSIRNIEWKDDTFFIESGGGVLPESELHKELDEIILKRNSIKRHYL